MGELIAISHVLSKELARQQGEEEAQFNCKLDLGIDRAGAGSGLGVFGRYNEAYKHAAPLPPRHSLTWISHALVRKSSGNKAKTGFTKLGRSLASLKFSF